MIDTDQLFVDAVPGRRLEVQYGTNGQVFDWHNLREDQRRHNVPMPCPGRWDVHVRFAGGGGGVWPEVVYPLDISGGAALPLRVCVGDVRWDFWRGQYLRDWGVVRLCVPPPPNTGLLIPDDKVVAEDDVVVDNSVSWSGSYGCAHPAQYHGRPCVIKVSLGRSLARLGTFERSGPLSVHAFNGRVHAS